jgi:hypothetical protein
MASHLKSLRNASLENARIFVQTMITLASASLGLVAALAWNEAIKATIKTVFKTEDSLAGLYTYAILTTVLAIVVLTLQDCRQTAKYSLAAAVLKFLVRD